MLLGGFPRAYMFWVSYNHKNICSQVYHHYEHMIKSKIIDDKHINKQNHKAYILLHAYD